MGVSLVPQTLPSRKILTPHFLRGDALGHRFRPSRRIAIQRRNRIPACRYPPCDLGNHHPGIAATSAPKVAQHLSAPVHPLREVFIQNGRNKDEHIAQEPAEDPVLEYRADNVLSFLGVVVSGPVTVKS